MKATDSTITFHCPTLCDIFPVSEKDNIQIINGLILKIEGTLCCFLLIMMQIMQYLSRINKHKNQMQNLLLCCYVNYILIELNLIE